MSQGHVPYLPLDTPKPVAEGVWIVDGPEIRFGPPVLKFPFPTRMTVIRLPDGGLWLHSPTEPTQALADRVLNLGEVRWLIAPNTIHYWWIPDWKARFPDAEVFAAPGLERSAKRPLPPHQALGDAPPTAWAGVIDQTMVTSRLLTEVDFFHRPTRTLILADLIENFEPARVRNWLHRQIIRLGGVADPDGKTPKDMQLAFRSHRQEVGAAVRKMIAWAPQRVVLAHGRWYEHDGVAELERAFRWVL